MVLKMYVDDELLIDDSEKHMDLYAFSAQKCCMYLNEEIPLQGYKIEYFLYLRNKFLMKKLGAVY